MVEINLHPETPTQAVVRVANETTTVTDARGRVLTIKKLGLLDRMRLMEIVGEENTNNGPYFGYTVLAYCVQSIDGDAIARPASKMALEALLQRLDDDGVEASAKALGSMNQGDNKSDLKAELKNE